MHCSVSVNMPPRKADGCTSQRFQIHTVQCFTTHNTMKSLYESKNSYLSCGLQLEQKKLLTKLLWEQLDRFKKMNSTLETIVTRSNCNNLSSTHLNSRPKSRDYLYLYFLRVCFSHKGIRPLCLAGNGLIWSEAKFGSFIFRGKNKYHLNQQSRCAEITLVTMWILGVPFVPPLK